MGGKHKQANRTKNNARPSSSSHSAELLGNSIPTFFGFSVIKDGVSAVSGFPIDENNYSINSDFQIIFKQMNKKDPTTRFKALQMFTDLCNSAEVNDVKAVLPLWPRMYSTLCTDIDHKVRESSHQAHRAVVMKVKKMIAPYLKELAGPWFTSQYDTYAPAASAATLAFEEAFPSTKLNKAIVFCQEEILFYIYDNLINQTPQTLSNPNTTSPEDMQAKYERIIIASLQGYSLYLHKLSSEQIQEAEDSNKKILTNQKFWKYAKNKVPLIRSCFFNTLIALCQKAKFLLKGESSHLNTSIFNNLNEADPVVLQAVWDAALNVLVSMEDCCSQINIEKQVFAKLGLILKGGGRNLTTIYPNILPLLSKLPEDAIKDKEIFYQNLFENIRCGLEMNSYSKTTSEIKIAATTFIECLKYVVLRNSFDKTFCISLIENQLVPAIEQKLSTDKKQDSLPLLIQTATLIHYWHLNRSDENPAYENIVETFFLSLLSSFTTQLNSEMTRSSVKNILNSQIEFISILLNPSRFQPKSKGRVKFEEDIKPEVVEAVIDKTDFDFLGELLPFVKKIAVFYFKNAILNEDCNYIPAISKIVESFDSRLIFEEMVTSVQESTAFKLFTSYFSKWLMNEDMKCGELVDLSFSLLKYVTDDEKEYILEEFSSNWCNNDLLFNVCKVLPNYLEDVCIIKWVRSERFAKSIYALAKRYLESEEEDKTSRQIIVALLKARCINGEFIMDENTANSIVDLVSQFLEKSDRKTHIIELSQDLVTNAKTEQISKNSLETMVAALFKLWCQEAGKESLAQACKTGLKIVLNKSQKINSIFDFTKKLKNVVHEIVLNDNIKFYPEQIVANINVYIDLALNTNLSDSCSSNLEISKAIEIIKIFLEKISEWKGDEEKMIEKCCRLGFEANGILDLEYLELQKYLDPNTGHEVLNEWENYPEFNLSLIKNYAKWNLYIGSVLNLIAAAHPRCYKTSVFSFGLKAYEIEERDKEKISIEKEKDKDIILVKISKEEESKLKNDLEVIESVFHEPEYNEENTLEPLLEHIRHFLLSVGFLESFIKYYASMKHYQTLQTPAMKLKTIACDLLKNVNFVEFKYIYDHFRNSIRKQPVWWLVQNTFQEIFNRKFMRSVSDSSISFKIAESRFEELQKLDIAKLPMHGANYLKFLGLMDVGFGHRFTEEQWDKIFVYVHNFFEQLANKSDLLKPDLVSLIAVSRLYLKLKKSLKENHLKSNEEKIHEETCIAWNEIVEAEIYNKFLIVWRDLAKRFNQEEILPENLIVLQNLSDVVIDGLSLRKIGNLQESVDLELECSQLMTSPHAVIQITSYHLCLSVIPDLVKLDTEIFGNHVTQMFQDTNEDSSLFKQNSNSNWTAKNLTEEIVRVQGIVEILLSDFIVGDCCTVEPFTDSFTYTYSYLLLWCFLLNMCGEAHSPLRFQYSCWLQEAGYSNTFLESVFKLMPQAVLHSSEAKENCQKYFENYGLFDFRESVKSERIEQIACFVYRLFLQRLPNVVREWWNQSENKTSALVDKVTRLYVSPILISNELKNVQQDRETGFDNMEIKTYPGSREIIATYTIDEVKMDLIMNLPQNYPLGTIKVESSNVVVSTSNWRNWLFHICKFLIHQNGTIWDALVIWKNNLDKKFEGVEECYICFSILQGSTFEIPRLCCHTCKKKFHSNCLYKWFNTSNKSTCPICRNLF